jgi:putative transposase
VGLSRAAFYRLPPPSGRDDEVIDALNELLGLYPRWGFWKYFNRLRKLGRTWNHKRVLRVYRAMKLNLPRRKKRRLPEREHHTLEVPTAVNAIWALDFVSDSLYNGRRFRTLNVIDEGVREALDIVVDTSLTSKRVARELEKIRQWRGTPDAIRCDNGPEFIGQAFVDWCEAHKIKIRYIQPGKPNQNAYIERFNRSYRNEVLNAYLFEDLNQVRRLTIKWLRQYNEERPHDSLGGETPTDFRRALKARVSTLELST